MAPSRPTSQPGSQSDTAPPLPLPVRAPGPVVAGTVRASQPSVTVPRGGASTVAPPRPTSQPGSQSDAAPPLPLPVRALVAIVARGRPPSLKRAAAGENITVTGDATSPRPQKVRRAAEEDSAAPPLPLLTTAQVNQECGSSAAASNQVDTALARL